MIPDRRDFTNGFIEMLERGTRKKVGDHSSPPDTPALTVEQKLLVDHFPYCVVYTIEGGQIAGTELGKDYDDISWIYQITSVGLTRDQCEWMADTSRRSVVEFGEEPGTWAVPLVCPEGWVVNGRLPAGGSGSVEVAGTPPTQIYSTAERFELKVTKA